MLYAEDDTGKLIEPAPRASGICRLCRLPLIPKCGQINVWHWSHRAGDCDPWNEGETDWHRGWKRRAPASWCEVVWPPHRADIRRADGLVIELQYSSISAEDIATREAFYGNMWWLFHRERFGKKARFFLTDDCGVRMRWLHGSRTLPLVNKPMFCDLGGPIVEFTAKVDRVGGSGRLYARREFLEHAGLEPLNADELSAFSHYEVRWPHRADGLAGVVAPSSDDLMFWRTGSKLDGREIRAYRFDGTYDVINA